MKYFSLLAPLLALALHSRCQAQAAELHTYTFPQATVETRVKAVFDSAAVFVDGRLLNRETKKPVANALIVLNFGPGRKREKTVRTAENGTFRLGWIGSAPERLLAVRAAGYEVLKTDKLPLGSGVHTQLDIYLAERK